MRRSPSGMTIEAEDAERERVRAMTGSFDDLVRHRMSIEPGFADALRAEALDAIRTGDAETGMSMLREYFGETEPVVELAAAK